MNNTADITNEELKWIGVDFDGTLAYSEPPDFQIGLPIDGAVETMIRLDSQGFKITIFTARPWVDYHKIESWCRVHGIPARRIICGKPLFKFLIDDRNIEFNGDWGSVLAKVKPNDQERQYPSPTPNRELDSRPGPRLSGRVTIHDPAEDNICDGCQ